MDLVAADNMEKTILTNIDYSSFLKTITFKTELSVIGNDFIFKDVHDEIMNHPETTSVFFFAGNSDLNVHFRIAELLKFYKPDLLLYLCSEKENLDSLEIDCALRPIPFNRIRMGQNCYVIKNDKVVKLKIDD